VKQADRVLLPTNLNKKKRDELVVILSLNLYPNLLQSTIIWHSLMFVKLMLYLVVWTLSCIRSHWFTLLQKVKSQEFFDYLIFWRKIVLMVASHGPHYYFLSFLRNYILIANDVFIESSFLQSKFQCQLNV